MLTKDGLNGSPIIDLDITDNSEGKRGLEMESALSLKNGDYIDAAKANYETSKKLLLVCPECGEPVHFKLREIPYRTPFFAHPREEVSIKLMKACSLRVDGSEYKSASLVVPGIAHGQLVNKFQREFCKDIYESMGTVSSVLVDFIAQSGFLNLEKKDYRDLIDSIERLTPDSGILVGEMQHSEERFLKEGVEDVCRFLRSPYGIWVGNYIYQAAYFMACMVHPDTVNRHLGITLQIVKKTKTLFVVEAYRLKSWEDFAATTMAASDKRNIAIFQIAASLVSYLLHKWRFKERIPELIHIADGNFEITKLEKPYKSTVSTQQSELQGALDESKNVEKALDQRLTEAAERRRRIIREWDSMSRFAQEEETRRDAADIAAASEAVSEKGLKRAAIEYAEQLARQGNFGARPGADLATLNLRRREMRIKLEENLEEVLRSKRAGLVRAGPYRCNLCKWISEVASGPCALCGKSRGYTEAV